MQSRISNEQRLRILHLEDNDNDAELVKINLDIHGVDCAITRVQAEEQFESALTEGAFDVIISDSKLPGFDTSRALSAVRERRPEIPFVYFTGNAAPDVKRDALEHGAFDFISKDDLARLIMLLRRVRREKRHGVQGPDPLPPIGKAVIVRGEGFRCMAYRDRDGKWKDYFRMEELPGVIEWCEEG